MKLSLPLALVLSLVLLSSCQMDNMDPGLAPIVTNLNPSSGKIGDTITIIGEHFSPQVFADAVKFNDSTAHVISATTTTLIAVVPAGATTGKVSVTVSGRTGLSPNDFIVTNVAVSSIAITSFTPARGVVDDTVILTGTGFSSTMTQDLVKFGGNITATVFEATATQLKMKVPASAVTGTISVTVGASTATSTSSFEMLQDIPRSGLVAYYPFSGNADDASGHGFNLSVVGTYALVADRFGVANKAYFFNGGNSYAISPNQTDASVSQPLTVASWIKYDSLISSTIFGKYGVSGGFLFGLVSNGAVMMYQNQPNYVMSNAGVIPVNTGGQWIFLAATYDGTTMSFYKNGVLAQSIPSTNPLTATDGSLRIGLSGDGGTGPAAFKCSIDDVTIYNRVLSAAEIQQLYVQTVSKK